MDSSRHTLYYIAETTYGVTPATPAFKKLRHTGATLALSKGMMVSDEVRDDRQIADARHGTKQVGGEVSGELSYGTYDELMEAALGGAWTAKAAPYAAGTISAAAADNSINDSANGLPLLDPGDKVTISGFTGAVGNNQAKLTVVTSTAGKMVLSGGNALVNDAAGETVTITTLTQTLKIGTTRRSFSFLRNFTDQVNVGDNPFHLFTGQEINNLSLTIGVEKIVAIALAIVGKDQPAPSDTAPAGTTYVLPNTNKPFDAFTGSLYEGGSVIATVTEVTATLENGVSPRFVVCSDVTRRPSIGRANGTGQITAYAENASLLKKFINQTESSLKLLLTDGDGNSYRFSFPRIKYTGGQMDVKGQGPITIPAPFQALCDSVTGTTLIVDRIAA